MEALIRTYQLWAGLRDHVLTDTQPCPWIPSQWLTSLRQSMHANDIKIKYASWTVPPLRHGDRYLMDDFCQQDFPRHKLEKLNACRMFLQVTTLAEITDHTGTEILPQIVTHRPHSIPTGLTNISHSTLLWPHVSCPTPTCCRIWTTTICTLYTGWAKGMRLSHPLGPWLATYEQMCFWHWWLLHPTALVYSLSPTSPTCRALPTLTKRTFVKFFPTVPTDLPFHGPPVTPTDPTLGYVRLPVPTLPIAMNPITLAATSFKTLQQQFRSSLPTWKGVLFGSLRKAFSTKTLYKRLTANMPIIIVSDALVQNHGYSGFAWIIAQDATPLWRGLGLAPGPADDMYSGCAEAFGLYAAASFLQYYLTCYPPIPLKKHIPCYCDNSGVITSVNALLAHKLTRPNDTTMDDRDIHLAIYEMARQCGMVKLQFWHVKGHQDLVSNHQLTVEEQHNVDCDRLAKRYVLDTPLRSTDMVTPEFPIAKPHLYIAGKLICRRVLKSLRNAAATPEYWDYLSK